MTASPGFAEAVDEHPIVIHADKAWEGEDGEVMYFEGNFEMRSSDWRVAADRAEMKGQVEDPVEIVVFGDPARIHVTDPEDASATTAIGDRIVYRYADRILELYGDAEIETADATMTSSVIIYDLGREKLKSSGPDGVKMVFKPSFLNP